MKGKEIYQSYENYYLNHIGEDTEDANYAHFIWGLPLGASCYKAFPYSEVYAKLEEAERKNKKLSLSATPNQTTTSSVFLIQDNTEFCDDDSCMELILI